MITTGILIAEPEVKLFSRCGIKNLELSLLGATSETHDSIMRFPGAFRKTLKAVKLLRANGIGVSLKLTIMKENYRVLTAMVEIARRLDAGFSASITILPSIDGNTSPQIHALDEHEIELLDPRFLNGGLIPEEEFKGGALLTCAAGRSVCGISPQGDIFPCIILRHKLGNIRDSSLKEIWHNNPDPILYKLRSSKPEDISDCFACEQKPFCKRCPGIAYLETGQIDLPAFGACATAGAMKRIYDRNGYAPSTTLNKI